MNSEVDSYLNKSEQWREELALLRVLLIESGLIEELKWSAPCYTYQQSNIAVIGRLKQSCVLSFFKGSLLKDPKGLLSKPGPNTQYARVIKFANLQEIRNIQVNIREYIQDAINVEKEGLKVEVKKEKQPPLIEELDHILEEDEVFRSAFYALTPGRQRAYHLYFSAAKQSSTRMGRIDKYRERILGGKGINDCICGRSKRMPNCDGSHKDII